MAASGSAAISDREAEVLAALGEHLTNAEVAQQLHISIRTVESHVSALLRKLGAADRRALAVIAAGDLEPTADPPGPAIRGLPTVWTSFVGRTAELDEVIAALTSHRLVTLLGPGGIGKSRLAVEASGRLATSLSGGGAFVDLVPVGPSGVASAVAAAVGAIERPQTPIETVIHEHLRGGPALVVLDNCEHVLDAAAGWAEAALAACPELVVLATSRERLGIGGERVVAVPPLGDEAAELFTDRAAIAAGDPVIDPTSVEEICQRLDGMPLAIELAAARVASLGADGLLAGLDDHLRLLGRSGGAGGSAGRHRSLRAVIEWSHDLLDDEERMVLRRLAVFAGAFDLASAASVAASGDAAMVSDVIGRLADKSLLARRQEQRDSRWQMLETVRAYAREHLEASGDRPAIEGAHLEWAAATSADLEAGLGRDEGWVERFDAVADDLRAAFFRPATAERAAVSFSLGLGLGHLTYARGLLGEARGHGLAASARAPDASGKVLALRFAADVARADQRLSLHIDILRQAAELAEETGQRAAAAGAFADIARALGRFPAALDEQPDREETLALIERARVLDPGDEPSVAAAITLAAAWNGRPVPTEPDPELADEALAMARTVGDPLMISDALDAVACAATFSGRRKEAARLTGERLDLVDQMPRHRPECGLEVFDVFHMTTETAIAVGDLEAAMAAGRRAQAEEIDAALPWLAASRLAIPLVLLGEFDEAAVQAQRMRDSWDRSGRPTAGWMSGAVFSAAMVWGLRGDTAAFDDWWELALEVCTRSDDHGTRTFVQQRVDLHRGRFDPGRHGRTAEVSDFDTMVEYAAGIDIELAIVAGAADAEERLDEARSVAAEHEYAAAILQRASGRLHQDPAELDAAVAMFESIGARFERACTLALLAHRRAEGEAELAALGCPPPAPVG